jgi:hypothetical protein
MTLPHASIMAVSQTATTPTIAQRLVYSLHEMHRPEVADMVLYATIAVSGSLLLLEPHPFWREEIGSARQWYEDLLTLAALRVGLSIETTLICLPPERPSHFVIDYFSAERDNAAQPAKDGTR